jgi:hypothetical protein
MDYSWFALELFKMYESYGMNLSRAQRTRTKSRTQQGKQLTRNASLNIIQDWNHKYAKQEHAKN